MFDLANRANGFCAGSETDADPTASDTIARSVAGAIPWT